MPNRKPLIAGNWKMFKTCAEAVETAKQLMELVAEVSDIEVMVAPPFTALYPVANTLKGGQVLLGAQNLHWEKEGAYTGEISPLMLVSAGCRYVIIGHSERRQYFGETDEDVNKKIKAAVKHDLIPIFCIGESEQERESGQTFSVLDKQVKKGVESPTSRYGQSAPVKPPPVIRHRRYIISCVRWWVIYSAKSWPHPSEYFMVAASNRKIFQNSWPGRILTAPWLAAPV
jgi:triosephosphate isomerase